MGSGKKVSLVKQLKITSPYLYEEIGEVQAITTEEVDEAIYYAQIAQKNWAETSLQERAKFFLYQWADKLVNMQEEIAEIIMKEVGKKF
ncbi:hypothetical protein GCM10020331_011270 [Ectobacillus funiculus]